MAGDVERSAKKAKNEKAKAAREKDSFYNEAWDRWAGLLQCRSWRRALFIKMGPYFIAAASLDSVQDRLEVAEQAMASLDAVPITTALHSDQLKALIALNPDVSEAVGKESFFKVMVANKILRQLSMLSNVSVHARPLPSPYPTLPCPTLL